MPKLIVYKRHDHSDVLVRVAGVVAETFPVVRFYYM